METIFETPNISLDFDSSRENRDLGAYRITTSDKYGHYDDEIYLSRKQLKELLESTNGYTVDVEEEFL